MDNERQTVKGNKAQFKVWGWRFTRGAWDVFLSQKRKKERKAAAARKDQLNISKRQLERSSTGKRWNNLSIKTKNDGSLKKKSLNLHLPIYHTSQQLHF